MIGRDNKITTVYISKRKLDGLMETSYNFKKFKCDQTTFIIEICDKLETL